MKKYGFTFSFVCNLGIYESGAHAFNLADAMVKVYAKPDIQALRRTGGYCTKYEMYEV